jgi:hypothetical protein
MAEEETSSGTSAMPTPDQPATGTTASQGATPPTKSLHELEEARARIAELEHSLKNKAEEASRHGKNLTTKEKELAAYQEKERLAQEAALSDAQKLERRVTEAEARVAEYQAQAEQYKQKLITAKVQIAAQGHDIIDLDYASWAVQTQLEFDEDGMPNNLDKVLTDLKKQKPFLLKKAPEPAPTLTQAESPPASPSHATPPQAAPAVQTPAVPVMSPGRTNIVAPGTLPPNQPMRLTEIDWKR